MVPSVARSGRLLRFRCLAMISCAAVGLLGGQLTANTGIMRMYMQVHVFRGFQRH